MARVPVLFQETRISPTPLSPSTILQIDTQNNTAVAASSAGRKRPLGDSDRVDEDTYARKRLATEGSVFFRPATKSPRCFLWRILDGRKLLEIQCVDLVQDAKGQSGSQEALLTFHLPFSTEILPGGVQCADVEGKDALELFVLTQGNELYTVTLKRDLLVRELLPINFDPATCLKVFSPASFSFRHPYRFIAISSLELYISLHDGGLMRLERSANQNGSQWHETFFSEGGWSGTIKSWNPFGKSQTVRYGNTELESSAIAAIAKSPSGEHVWTVSLDHTLRAWSTKTGKVVVQKDLLDEHIDEDVGKSRPSPVLSAEQGTLIQIVPALASANDRSVARVGSEGPYGIVVHSPRDHQFKFYGITTTFSSIDGPGIDFKDLYPGIKMIPPVDELMNANIWHLEHFTVQAGHGWQDSELWLHARNGPQSKVLHLTFDLLDENDSTADIVELWRNGWTVVDAASLSIENLKESQEFSGLDAIGETATTASESWLKCLFYPARFSEDSLETALQVYQQGRGLSTIPGKGFKTNEPPLKERLVAAISAKLSPRRLADDEPDYDQYHLSLQTQWHTFFSVLAHIHKRRLDPIGFAFDPVTGLPWTICADLVAPIRLCSGLEKLSINTRLMGQGGLAHVNPRVTEQIFVSEDDQDQCVMLGLARQFRNYLSASAQHQLRSLTIDNALGRREDQSAEETLSKLYETCGFANEITDDDFQALNKTADYFHGLGNLTDDTFLMVLESLDESSESKGGRRSLALGRYGAKLNVAIMQETLQNINAVLLDMIALLTFMHGDLEPSELDKDFRPAEIHEAIMSRLRQNELRLWLAGNVRGTSRKNSNKTAKEAETIYEDLFIGDWRANLGQQDTTYPELVTLWSMRWIFYLDVTHQRDDITCHIMANLVKGSNVDLATDFVRFLSEGPWQSYLKGRLYLATGEYATASIAFREPADHFATTLPTVFAEDNLLSAEERSYFGSGRVRYLQHVLSLFEKLKAFSYVADFATLALDGCEGDEDILHSLTLIDSRKNQTNSPAPQRVQDTMEEIRLIRLKEVRNDISGRLFNALVQTERFERAYDTLKGISKPELQKGCLQTLLQACVKQDNVSTLLELPITGDLAQEADNILASLAKKSMALVSPSSTPPYHQIIFAFRTQQSNFRGAAAVLYEHLERLRRGKKFGMQDPEDETLVRVYALLINTLACCGKDQGWLLADPMDGITRTDAKRKLVTLGDVRREYAAELDRRNEVLLGRFALVGGDEMDVL